MNTYLIVLAISILPTLAIGKLIAQEQAYSYTDKEGEYHYDCPNYVLAFSWTFYIPCLLMAAVSFFEADGLMMTLVLIPIITHVSIFSLSFLLGKKY